LDYEGVTRGPQAGPRKGYLRQAATVPGASPARRSSSAPTIRWVIHSSIRCAPMLS